MTQYTNKQIWYIMAAAAAILLITMGARQSVGLFVHPLHMSSGMSIADISLALAIGQFVWGAVQPFYGAAADKYGSRAVLYVGTALLFIGSVWAPYWQTTFGVTVTLGLLSTIGAGAGSFSVLIGAVSAQLPPEKRSFAGGFINAGGSMGQFVYAPILQVLISAFGWVFAMVAMGFSTLLSIPLIEVLCGQRKKKVVAATAGAVTGTVAEGAVAEGAVAAGEAAEVTAAAKEKARAQVQHHDNTLTIKEQLKQALTNRSFIFLSAGFFTCGFHVAFLVTHLPGEVALCGLMPQVSANSLAFIGLFNIVGSLLAGWAGNRYRMKYILALVYGSRAVMIAAYLLAPKTELTFYIFSMALGMTWLATVPPTAGIVGKLFGTRYMAMLFGITLFSHQIGGFLGAYLGGLAVTYSGNYEWMWYADMILGALAALVNLPIKEDPVPKEL